MIVRDATHVTVRGRPRFPPPGRLVFIVCVAEIVGMSPFSMFLALQPQLRDAWQLSNTASGWISSAYYAGYMVAVPVLASLTDRVDARTVWLAAMSLGAAAALGFGLAAEGLWSAVFFQFLAGASLAGTYMPGLKLIADRTMALPHPRYVAFYTTSFTIGSSLSFYAIGRLGEWTSWRAAIALSAVGPAIAWLLAVAALRPVPTARHSSAAGAAGHWQQVFRSRDAMRYVAGYTCHMWELFAIRAWVVPFLTFCGGGSSDRPAASASTVAALIGLVGVPASLAGAEMTARYDRRAVVVTVMLVSAATTLVFGLTAGASWIVVAAAGVISSVFVSADSAALTSGIVAVAPPASRGTAMALYSMAGFASASAGSFAVGVLLDALGGQSVTAWAAAFGLMGASNVLGAAILWRSGRPDPRRASATS